MSNNEQDSSRSFFQPSLSFCRTEDLARRLRPDACEKLSAGLNALLKVLLGRPFNSPAILQQLSDASSGAGRHPCAHKYLTSWITGDIRRRIRFPNWIRYIISISTAGTIGLWYIEGRKGHRLGRCGHFASNTAKTWKGEMEQKPAGTRGGKDIGLKYWTDYWLLSGIWPRSETLNGSFSRSPRGRWIL